MNLRVFISARRISFGICGRYTLSELVAFSLSILLVLIWIVTGHWLFMDGRETATFLGGITLRLPFSDRHGLVYIVHRSRSVAEFESLGAVAVGSRYL